METVPEPSSEANDDNIVKQKGMLSEKTSEDEYFSRMKRYYPGEEQPKPEHTRQSLDDKSTGNVPGSSHEDPMICYMVTDSTLTSKEESYDNENHHLTLIEEKDELMQNSKEVRSATNLPTSFVKIIEIPDKKESSEEPASDTYFIKKIKGRRVRNEQKEFFIIWT